ncbi:MAG: tRNA lysidine(34) synthetase TilS [Schwartzia sp.]|nr:tRNA lysidine(34) synthetase TilS [Schwartzia sp. (in: firmicutes)]
MELERKVASFVRRHGIFAPGSRIVIACSGGPDSLALAEVLLALRDAWRLSLGIAHFEHGIRGEASLADASFVREYAEKRGLFCRIGHGDVPAYARRAKLSLETAARQLRYAFLNDVAREMGEGTLIATGHHAGDQAETVLMHLFRGSGLDGLAGMRPRAGAIIRPLLCLSRAEIEAYCREKQLEPRRDETNFLPDAERNRVRLEILPLLRRYRPSLDDALCRLAAAEAEAVDFLRAAADEAWAQVMEERGGTLVLRREAYGKLPAAVRKAILRRAAEILGLRSALGFSHYEALDTFCRFGETGKRLMLPQGGGAECRYASVVFRRTAEPSAKWEACPFSLSGVTRIESIGLTVYASPWKGEGKPEDPMIAVADLDALSSPLVVRGRRDGDSFSLENGGRQKVKSLLIDRKVPHALRDRVPIFTAGGEIFWIGGIRRAAVALVSESTQRVVAFRMEWDDRTDKGENGT